MSKQIAQQEAIRLAVAELQKVDLAARCPGLGLPAPANGRLRFRALGLNLLLQQADFALLNAVSGAPAQAGDQILILHYLSCAPPLVLTDELISFRALPGGQFYWQPFLSRTVKPLLSRIGNNSELLRANLARFDWVEAGLGDFSARIHAVGKLFLTLVFYRGDDEFPPTADVLFDACIKHVFVTEDAAVLASRICLGLL